MSVTPRRTLFALAIFSAVPLLVACPKKQEAAPFDAGPPPAPVEDVQTSLVPMEEDAGMPDADADAAKPKYTGPAVNTTVLRLKQCCAAIGKEGDRMGASPEGNMFKAAAAQCSALAVQAGSTGTAPEFAVIRGMLAGRQIPAACAGL